MSDDSNVTTVPTVVERISAEAAHLQDLLDGFFESDLGQVIFSGTWATEPELHSPVSEFMWKLCEVREVFQPKYDATVWKGNADGTIPLWVESIRKERENKSGERAPKTVAEQIAAARKKVRG